MWDETPGEGFAMRSYGIRMDLDDGSRMASGDFDMAGSGGCSLNRYFGLIRSRKHTIWEDATLVMIFPFISRKDG